MSRKLKDMQDAVDKGLAKSEKKRRGAPSFPYSIKIAKEICHAISKSPYGLKKICDQNSHFPSCDTVYDWIIDIPEFSQMYDKAKEMQVEMRVDDAMERSYDDSRDMYHDGLGGLKPNSAAVARDKLIADNVKWYASKLKRRKYGEKATIETIDLTHEQGLESLDK